MFEYFYNEILRRTIIGFGTLFNGISIKQRRLKQVRRKYDRTLEYMLSVKLARAPRSYVCSVSKNTTMHVDAET